MKSKLSMILFILILGSTLTMALVSVDQYTAPLIAKNQERKLHVSILESLGIDYSEDNVDETFSSSTARLVFQYSPYRLITPGLSERSQSKLGQALMSAFLYIS